MAPLPLHNAARLAEDSVTPDTGLPDIDSQTPSAGSPFICCGAYEIILPFVMN